MTDLPRLALDSATVVVRGEFTPSIFSPDWMLANGLIGEREATNAKVDVISQDITVFTAGWLRCNVTRDNLQVTTQEPAEFERTRDVAVGVLRLLRFAPVGAVGLNRNVHLATDGAQQWHSVGDHLTPKDLWDGVLEFPGMRSVAVWASRGNTYPGRRQIQIEPSGAVQYGIFVAHNDHYDLSARSVEPPKNRENLIGLPLEESIEPTLDKIELALEVLTTEWEASMSRAVAVINRVAKQVKL